MLPPCLPASFCSNRLTVREKITTEDFQDGRHGGHYGYDSDGDVKNVKSYWQTYELRMDPGQQTTA